MIATAAGVASRFFSSNLHTVEAGVCWRVARSKLPDDRLMALLRRHGIRNLVDLRSPTSSGPDLAGVDFAALGVTHSNIHLRASVLPPPSVVLRYVETIASGEGPFLLLCKRGKDKTGFASALWRAIRCGDDAARAFESQLRFVPFGHRRETHPGPWRFLALFQASGSRDLARWCRQSYPSAYAWAASEDAARDAERSIAMGAPAAA